MTQHWRLLASCPIDEETFTQNEVIIVHKVLHIVFVICMKIC